MLDGIEKGLIFVEDRGDSFQDKLKKEALCLLLVCTKPEKLQKMETRDDMTVSAHMRGAVIPASVSKGFLRACTLGSVALQFHASMFIKRLFGGWMA